MSELHALPLGYPPVLDSPTALPQVSGKSAGVRETKSGNLSLPATHVASRVSRKRLQTLATNLSERDLAILSSVDQFRFVTGSQLMAFHFAAHASPVSAERTCRRVLARLRELRVLGVLEQRIGGVRAGSDGLVYYVNTVGDRVLRQENPARTRRRVGDPSTRFLDHTLATTGLAAQLQDRVREHGAEIVRLAAEPAAHRHYTDLLGTPQVIKPDLEVELAAVAGDEDVAAFFVEVDLGHESIPTLVGKCLAYESYRQSGEEQRRYGGFPVIVWAMTATRQAVVQRRQRDLARALERNPRIDSRAYRIFALSAAADGLLREAHHG
ncbi:replication-relaxation family protein [Arthrobacter sp. CJ23]|uniref:replication-relaxation family protein n=1 Tax=Arthrobacter sp. CJ23 TaxID=2972479 RepID=UPI00215BDD99|nr:replication-relaxation family protein [Arthrobacter sp. CJ23]UVJ38065.1 replication-relaxation family protein [Arthrobacter sp. CJ23]